jgi:CBS domain-containing membrane protein
LFEDERIRHLPVVDEDGNLVGLLSQRDLARRALGQVEDLPMEEKHAILAGQRVDEIMSRNPETAVPDEDLVDAAERMLENKLGCLPVLEGGELVGILTESDFVRLYVEKADDL